MLTVTGFFIYRFKTYSTNIVVVLVTLIGGSLWIGDRGCLNFLLNNCMREGQVTNFNPIPPGVGRGGEVGAESARADFNFGELP